MFQPGQSGNPKGKPKGAPDKRRELRDMLRPHAPALIKKAIDMALDGDTVALKLCIDKLLPPLKAMSTAVTFPLDPALPLADQGKAILQAVADGALPSSEGVELLSALAGVAKLVELDEITRRIEAIEQATAGPHQGA